VSLKTFAAAISAEWQQLDAKDRVERVKKLVLRSSANEQFIREFFPREYSEAMAVKERDISNDH
jgi:hypothetical protein